MEASTESSNQCSYNTRLQQCRQYFTMCLPHSFRYKTTPFFTCRIREIIQMILVIVTFVRCRKLSYIHVRPGIDNLCNEHGSYNGAVSSSLDVGQTELEQYYRYKRSNAAHVDFDSIETPFSGTSRRSFYGRLQRRWARSLEDETSSSGTTTTTVISDGRRR